MEFTKLIEEVITKSKPVRPNCSVCGGIMQSAEWDANGRELLVCSRIKPNNQQGDARVYDPQHYEKSKVRIAINVDMSLLRRQLAEAFGQVEAETETRVLNSFKAATPKVAPEPIVAESKVAMTAVAAADVRPAKRKSEAAS